MALSESALGLAAVALVLVAEVKVAAAALPRAEEVAARVGMGVEQKPLAAEAEVPRPVVVAEQARAVAVAEPLLSAVQL